MIKNKRSEHEPLVNSRSANNYLNSKNNHSFKVALTPTTLVHMTNWFVIIFKTVGMSI